MIVYMFLNEVFINIYETDRRYGDSSISLFTFVKGKFAKDCINLNQFMIKYYIIVKMEVIV